jgi:hypothetical protein
MRECGFDPHTAARCPPSVSARGVAWAFASRIESAAAVVALGFGPQ